MELEELVDIVETMALQHAYPGFDVRSLTLGLPAGAITSTAKLFRSALTHPNALVKLAALRWFWDKPALIPQSLKVIVACMDDGDEWVRLEAVRTIGRCRRVEPAVAIAVSKRLEDSSDAVRTEAAHAAWKLGCQDETVIAALHKAAGDACIEVKWKAEKALRKLGAYKE